MPSTSLSYICYCTHTHNNKITLKMHTTHLLLHDEKSKTIWIEWPKSDLNIDGKIWFVGAYAMQKAMRPLSLPSYYLSFPAPFFSFRQFFNASRQIFIWLFPNVSNDHTYKKGIHACAIWICLSRWRGHSKWIWSYLFIRISIQKKASIWLNHFKMLNALVWQLLKGHQIWYIIQ